MEPFWIYKVPEINHSWRFQGPENAPFWLKKVAPLLLSLLLTLTNQTYFIQTWIIIKHWEDFSLIFLWDPKYNCKSNIETFIESLSIISVESRIFIYSYVLHLRLSLLFQNEENHKETSWGWSCAKLKFSWGWGWDWSWGWVEVEVGVGGKLSHKKLSLCCKEQLKTLFRLGGWAVGLMGIKAYLNSSCSWSWSFSWAWQ